MPLMNKGIPSSIYIAYRFLPMLMIVRVIIVCVTSRDFGPMLSVERRARLQAERKKRREREGEEEEGAGESDGGGRGEQELNVNNEQNNVQALIFKGSLSVIYNIS